MSPVPANPELHRHLQSMGNQKPIRIEQERPFDQRVGVCIDIQNLYYGAKDLCGGKVNYNKFISKVANHRKLVKAVAYVAGRSATDQASFVNLLKNIGCDVRQKNVIEREGGKRCDWNVEMSVDACAMADKIDVFVLASGNGDFTYLLRALKMRGIRCEVIAFKENTANSLIDEADEFINIDKTLLMSGNFAVKPSGNNEVLFSNNGELDIDECPPDYSAKKENGNAL